MSEDNVAPAETPKGLDNILAAAIDQHMPAETPAEPAAETPTDTPAAEDTAPTAAKVNSAGKPINEKGQFVKADKAAPETTAAPATPAVEAPIDPPQAVDAPAHFTAEQRAKFATLTPEGQEIVRTTEKAREAEYTRRSQEASEYRKTADPFVEAVKPHMDYLKQIAPTVGNTPAGMIHAIIATERQLRTGSPQERYQAFSQLAQAYGIDPRALATGQLPAAQSQPQYQPVADPRIDQVTQELARFKSEREREVADRQISSFSTEKDEAGQPKYPYFEKVKHVMASIIQSGQAENLQDAYIMATAPIQDVIDKEIASRQATAAKAQQEALEKAKKATPVKSSSGAMPGGSNQAKGLDAHLKAAMANWKD